MRRRALARTGSPRSGCFFKDPRVGAVAVAVADVARSSGTAICEKSFESLGLMAMYTIDRPASGNELDR